MYDKRNNHLDCRDKTGGYTLIEILIAITIFSIGVLGVGSMQTRSTRGNTDARIGTEASVWAQDRVETLMQLPFTDPALAPGVHQVTEGGGLYTVNWTVYNSTGATPAGYPLWGVTPANRTIIIDVAVTGPRGTFRTNPSRLVFARSVNY